MQTIPQILAKELGKPQQHIENVIALLDEGNTIPFIARYRKEQHGSMDDTALRKLEDRLRYLRNLETRRQEVKSAIDGQGKLTEELAAAIDSAKTLAEVEDLYRPYKQKRRPRATMAKEKGLEPLAALLFAQERDCPRPEEAARDFVDPEKGVETVEDALQGASDIIAEQISDDAAIRKSLRALISRQGQLVSRAATEDDSVYRLYYDFTQSVARLQGHQVLAINRGEKEGILKVSITLDREQALPLLRRAVVKPGSAAMEFVKSAAEDAYDRLIFPSLEREVRNQLTEQADEGAIGQFALNLKPLLMRRSRARSRWALIPVTAWAARSPSWTAQVRCSIPTWSTRPTASGRKMKPSPRWQRSSKSTVWSTSPSATARPAARPNRWPSSSSVR